MYVFFNSLKQLIHKACLALLVPNQSLSMRTCYNNFNIKYWQATKINLILSRPQCKHVRTMVGMQSYRSQVLYTISLCNDTWNEVFVPMFFARLYGQNITTYTGAHLSKGELSKPLSKIFIVVLRIFNFECMISGIKVAIAQSDHTFHIE